MVLFTVTASLSFFNPRFVVEPSNSIAWLTTVGGDGRPNTVPLGFLWEGQTVLIFSQPKKQKLRNIRKNPRATLALDETNGGHDVVIVEGTAELIDDPQISVKLP